MSKGTEIGLKIIWNKVTAINVQGLASILSSNLGE